MQARASPLGFAELKKNVFFRIALSLKAAWIQSTIVCGSAGSSRYRKYILSKFKELKGDLSINPELNGSMRLYTSAWHFFWISLLKKKEHISCVDFWRLSTMYVTAPLCKGWKLLMQQYFEANPNPDLTEWMKSPLSDDTCCWESKLSDILSIPAGKFPLRSRPVEKGQSTKATCRAESLKRGRASVNSTKKSKPGPPAEEKSPRV